MELTIEQALKQGIAAHKEGKLQDAERLYRAILHSHPAHPDANHNLGVLAVSVNKADAALPLFKTALQGNPKIEQFWLSYLGALIKTEKFDDAREEIKKCKGIGHKSKAVDRLAYQLESRHLKQSVVSAVEQFYQSNTKRILSDAAVGWLFADSFDKRFMSDNPFSEKSNNEEHFLKNKSVISKNEQNALRRNSSQTLKELNSEKSIVKKYDRLKKLIDSDDVNIVNDSFKEDTKTDLGCAIEKTFDSETVNLVIIGGGVCGLFLANSIKNWFGDRANVLVLDNRSKHPNTRESFKRGWLTSIRTNYFKIGKSTNILPLLECFGTNGLIGIPINILETILQLSCKDQGVKFLFLENFDYSNLNNNLIDLVFDATGGRLEECSYSASDSADVALKIPKENINLNYAGVKQLYNLPGVGEEYLDVALKPLGDFHEPHIRDSKICVHMVKITGIPVNLIQTISEAIKKLNSYNMFYIWRGALRDEINEGLILINLLDNESQFLTSVIDDPITLKTLLDNNSHISNYLNRNISNILQMLAGLDVDRQVKIEQPFKYCPYVNLNAGFGLLGKQRVFAVGDSLFCGHPKLGNGLGKHLPFIKDLLEKITHAALPLFKTALEANPKIEHFWLSYIDALIKEEQFDNVKLIIEQAKTQGVAEEKLKVFETQLTPTVQVNQPKLVVQNKGLSFAQKRKKLSEKKKRQKRAKKQNLKANNPAQRQINNLLELYKNGQFDDAENLAVSMTNEFPKHQFGWKVLGAVLKQTGRVIDSLTAMQKSVDLMPQDADAHSNLGATLKELGRLEEAKASCNQAIALKPDLAEAHSNLGNTLQRLGRLDEAEASYKKAIALKRDYAEVHYNLGIMLKELGRLEEAQTSHNQAIALKPDLAEAHYDLGNTLQELGRLDEAKASYHKALACKPDYSSVKHMLAALSGETTTTAPRDYVEELFDNYAAKFESSLVDNLEYKIPKVITEMIIKDCEFDSLGSIMDLGCGSGLLGTEIKQFCDYLEGVDLSEKMLHEAKKKNIYNKLIKKDIVNYLSSERLNFDYFISTDVFVYVGELSDVFRLIKSRNKTGGKLAFSTETNEGDGFFLEQSGRYSHSKKYIESLCKTFGYKLRHFETQALRKEKSQYISGALYLLDF